MGAPALNTNDGRRAALTEVPRCTTLHTTALHPPAPSITPESRKKRAAHDPPKRRIQRTIQPISGLDFASNWAYVVPTTCPEGPGPLAARKGAERADLRALNARAELLNPANPPFLFIAS